MAGIVTTSDISLKLIRLTFNSIQTTLHAIVCVIDLNFVSPRDDALKEKTLHTEKIYIQMVCEVFFLFILTFINMIWSASIVLRYVEIIININSTTSSSSSAAATFIGPRNGRGTFRAGSRFNSTWWSESGEYHRIITLQGKIINLY